MATYLKHLRRLSLAGLLAFASAPAYSQNAATPAWGPTAPAGTEYYKLSAFNGYYNLRTKDYFYYSPEGKKWVSSDQPPMAFRGKDPKTFGATPITYKGTSPWRENEKPTTPQQGMAATPAWGPPAPAGTEYYKLSAFNGYYNLKTKNYYYYSPEGKKWVSGGEPPMAFRGKDPKTFGATPITYKGDSPWRENEKGTATTTAQHPAVMAQTPAWGPAAPAGTEYYRLGAFKGYYNLKTKDYFYYSPTEKKWVSGHEPPMAFRGKDPKTFGATPITYQGDSPWRENEKATVK